MVRYGSGWEWELTYKDRRDPPRFSAKRGSVMRDPWTTEWKATGEGGRRGSTGEIGGRRKASPEWESWDRVNGRWLWRCVCLRVRV